MASVAPRRYRAPKRAGSLCLMAALSVAVIVGSAAGYAAARRPYLMTHPVTVSLAGARQMEVSTAAADTFSVLSAAQALDAQGQCTGYVVITVRQGYCSPIQVQSTFAADRRTLAGIRILSQKETEYLGARISTQGFTDQFSGRLAPLRLSQATSLGSPIDGLSGSTISSAAVVEAVNAAYAFLQEE